jgi:hypothetical protein
MPNSTLQFIYDKRGYGSLVLEHADGTMNQWKARSGYVDTEGNLQHCIEPGTWYVLFRPVWTPEEAMARTPGLGWKVQLWRDTGDLRQYTYNGFLIHPDGGKPGSVGCIVLIDDADPDGLRLMGLIENILRDQDAIAVHVEEEEGSEI